MFFIPSFFQRRFLYSNWRCVMRIYCSAYLYKSVISVLICNVMYQTVMRVLYIVTSVK